MNCEWICSTTYHHTYHDCLLSILLDIQRILSSSDPVEVSQAASDDTIDRRLDDFLLQFQV